MPVQRRRSSATIGRGAATKSSRHHRQNHEADSCRPQEKKREEPASKRRDIQRERETLVNWAGPLECHVSQCCRKTLLSLLSVVVFFFLSLFFCLCLCFFLFFLFFSSFLLLVRSPGQIETKECRLGNLIRPKHRGHKITSGSTSGGGRSGTRETGRYQLIYAYGGRRTRHVECYSEPVRNYSGGFLLYAVLPVSSVLSDNTTYIRSTQVAHGWRRLRRLDKGVASARVSIAAGDCW